MIGGISYYARLTTAMLLPVCIVGALAACCVLHVAATRNRTRVFQIYFKVVRAPLAFDRLTLSACYSLAVAGAHSRSLFFAACAQGLFMLLLVFPRVSSTAMQASRRRAHAFCFLVLNSLPSLLLLAQLFGCMTVEGGTYLVADFNLECYDSRCDLCAGCGLWSSFS